LIDKIVNWNTLAWPSDGTKLLRRIPDGEQGSYWTNRDPSNMFVDNHPLPKFSGREYPLWVGLAYYLPITILLCVVDFVSYWFLMYYIRILVAIIYFIWVYAALIWLFKHPVPK
jgi:hypothetical protein